MYKILEMQTCEENPGKSNDLFMSLKYSALRKDPRKR